MKSIVYAAGLVARLKKYYYMIKGLCQQIQERQRSTEDIVMPHRMPGSGLFAVLRGIDTQRAVEAADVAVAAGFDRIEVTRHAGTVVVGAGKVLSTDDVRRVADCGGQLVVSPNMNTEVIGRTKTLGLLSVPGCFTPTEVFSALEAGADAIKLFPGTACSPETVAAVRAVISGDVPIFVNGGVGASRMSAYVRAGANGLGVGSSLCKIGKSMEEIRRDANELVGSFRHALEQARS